MNCCMFWLVHYLRCKASHEVPILCAALTVVKQRAWNGPTTSSPPQTRTLCQRPFLTDGPGTVPARPWVEVTFYARPYNNSTSQSRLPAVLGGTSPSCFHKACLRQTLLLTVVLSATPMLPCAVLLASRLCVYVINITVNLISLVLGFWPSPYLEGRNPSITNRWWWKH